MTDIKVKPSVRVPFKGEPDDNPVKILDTVPMGAEVLGNFPCVGDYGWDLDEAIGKCIKRAKKETNTHFVIAWKGKETDNKNSGTSVGFGASIAVSPTVDGSGAGSAGALFGNSYAEKRTFWNVHIRAYSDVDLTKIPDVCTAPPMPPAPPVLKPPVAPPPIPMPPPLPSAPPVVKKCDENRIWIEIQKREGEQCPNLGLKNLDKHLTLAYLDIDMYLCTGDATFLGEEYIVEKSGVKYKGAVGHFKMAEKNYSYLKKGQLNSAVEMKMGEAYKVWGWIIFHLHGENDADRFAYSHGGSYYKELK